MKQLCSCGHPLADHDDRGRRWESLPSVRVLACGDGLVTRVAVLERELAAARAVVGPAWLTGGVSLAEAIAAKCSMLERLLLKTGAR